MLTHHRNHHPDTRPRCTQPFCLLKQDGMNREKLAECLVALLAGQSPAAIVPGAEAICPRPQCANCTMRVMRESPAFFTAAEWEHLDDLGQWHQRRAWRRARRRARFWH
jgi:hypothetical protein